MTRVKEDHDAARMFKETVNSQHGRLFGRVDALEQSAMLRAQKVDDEHAVIYRRLEKLEDRTADLQRQVDRGAGV
jgi:hypothetical protein